LKLIIFFAGSLRCHVDASNGFSLRMIGEGKGKSRFPSGMTDRKAKAKAKARAKARARARAKADSLRE